MKEIGSASVDALTSESLVPLCDMIVKAQRKEVEQDLAEAKDALSKQERELARKRRSAFRYFYKRRISELQDHIPKTQAEVPRLGKWKGSTRIDVSSEAPEAAQKAYASLVRAFDRLRLCSKIWDVKSDRAADQFRERTRATRIIDRHPANSDVAATDLIHFAGQAALFENRNGEDILIYTGVAVMPRANGVFALIDVCELKGEGEVVGFQKLDPVSSDSRIIGETWAKTNKDGPPDRWFKNNFRISVCEYGRIAFWSKTGLTKEYQVSNTESAMAVAKAVADCQMALNAP